MSVTCRVFVDSAAEGETHRFVALPRVGEKVEIAGETLTVQSVTHLPSVTDGEVHIVVSTKTLGY